MVVVDASVIVGSYVSTDQHHLISKLWIQDYIIKGGRLLAPTVLLAEVCGVIRRETGRPNFGHRVGKELLAMAQLRLVPVDQQLGLLAMQIAVDLSMKGFDATYVAVADHLQVPLVTWDLEQLQRGTPRIKVYTPHDLSSSP